MSSDFNFYINRQGARGKQGEKGEQGFSPIVTVATDTPTEYTLNVVTEDSSFTTPNLKANAINIIPGAGKYVLFDESTSTMYNSAKPSELVDTTMFATTSNAGIIMIADNDDITQSSTDVAVTPKQLNDAIDEVESAIPTDTVSHTELNTAINGVTAQIPGIATSETAGIIKPDGVTTTVTADGTLAAIQSAPANMVTLDTEQTISANKSTTGTLHLRPNTIGAGDKTLYLTQGNITFGSGLASTAYNITTDNGDLKFAVTSYGTQSSGFTFTNNFTTIRLANTITIGDNVVLTSASVDGTTITYDNITGKISSTAAGDVTKAGNNDFTGSNTFVNIQSNAANGYKFSTTKNLVTFPNESSIFRYDQDSLGVYRDSWSETTETPDGPVTIDHPATSAKLIDSDSVDGTTIVFDSVTGKISSISSAPTVIDGGEEVVDISGVFSLSKYYEDTSYTGNEQDFFNGNGIIEFTKGTNNAGLIISSTNWPLFSNISFDATQAFVQVTDSNNIIIWSSGSYSTGTKTILVSSLTGISRVLIFSYATTGTLSNFSYNLI